MEIMATARSSPHEDDSVQARALLSISASSSLGGTTLKCCLDNAHQYDQIQTQAHATHSSTYKAKPLDVNPPTH